MTTSTNEHSIMCHLNVFERLDSQLQAFWKLEEPAPKAVLLTEQEQMCEEQYIDSVQRANDGKFIVKMPIKINVKQLGNSKDTAIKRLLQVERRLKKDNELNQNYHHFIKEYEELGHMEEVNNESSIPEYYLPHHPVLKSSSSTTKVRVVFDASAKTSTSLSLNDTLMVGPTVQDDLISILLRFRMHVYAMSADIEKMYRQIWVHPSQRELLKIIWRDCDTITFKTFQLKTVTYGTACAPYLATRTLNQLAVEEEISFPEASRVILSDFYVDDLLTGADDLDTAIDLQEQLIQLLKSGGFNLRKWNASNDKLLNHLPAHMRERHPQELPSNKSTSKALGLLWDAQADQLLYAHTTNEDSDIRLITKRTVLSEIAKLFDPLGLIAPVIIQAKIYMQELWRTKLDWDDELSLDFRNKWLHYHSDLKNLNNLHISRAVTNKSAGDNLELHGFCDASEQAYGAAIYIRHVIRNDSTTVSLLCAKSRVAPLKSVSLPRLELCGALLLTELMTHVTKALKNSNINIYYWTDSTIVLSWIAAEAVTWKTFVANRVAKIQDSCKSNQWRHVSSGDNPADLVSRGARVEDLLQSQLWWSGPDWLTGSQETWPSSHNTSINIHEDEERRRSEVSMHTTACDNTTIIENIINKFSSFSKLQRVTAYILRFIKNLRTPDNRTVGNLLPQEIMDATFRLLQHEQRKFFHQDYLQLISNKQVKPKSRLATLHPFIDQQGTIRVGGRLRHAEIDNNQRWPILLPDNSILTKLLITHEHIRNLHAGPQLLLSVLRQEYWPLNGRNLCRKTVHKCLQCFKAKPKWTQPTMGDLPKARVIPSRPFTNTGIDYCGPVFIKSSKLRQSKLIKGYIALFICFSTKALHLELVTDLTTEAFLSAFRRFIARRGICKNVYSDNGTNFVGANRELKELYTLIQSDQHKTHVSDATLHQRISWHFIPPNSPHFGGLWEAGVKSVKYHLKRTIGTANLTYEELSTTLTMVEACLNSRPLTSLSIDPNDPQPLTPGHFLIGEALTSLPDIDFTSTPENRLSRWQRTRQITQHFWKRWSTEYLSQLQTRQKWTAEATRIEPGQVVLVREDNLPPLKWVTAVIEDIHPGVDGRTRVATIRTTGGLYKRAVNRLCPLPSDR